LATVLEQHSVLEQAKPEQSQLVCLKCKKKVSAAERTSLIRASPAPEQSFILRTGFSCLCYISYSEDSLGQELNFLHGDRMFM
jgi:hypothetical protein